MRVMKVLDLLKRRVKKIKKRRNQRKQRRRKRKRLKKKRTGKMGELLRSKGFIWIATSHDVIGGWQQAGNIIRLEAESPWMAEIRDMWEGTPSEELVMKDILQSNGTEEHKYT